MRKKLIYVILGIIHGFISYTQGVGINATGSPAHVSALLDVDATGLDPKKGVLIPRMTKAERDAIISPATSLLIYQTDSTPGFYYFDGTAWRYIGGYVAGEGIAIVGDTIKTVTTTTGFWQLYHVDMWNPVTTTSLGWTCTGCVGASPWLTNCGGVKLLGGYNMCGSGCYFEKTFTNLPLHTEVMVEVFYFTIDSWDQANVNGKDYVGLRLNGTEVIRAYPSTAVSDPDNPNRNRNTTASFCGGTNWLDIGPELLVGYKQDANSSLVIQITNNCDQAPSDESLGIVGVRLWLK